MVNQQKPSAKKPNKKLNQALRQNLLRRKQSGINLKDTSDKKSN
jgi:hypothetical protein